VSKIVRQSRWWGVAGLVAAYALLLQSFFATSIATAAAAHDPAQASGVFFVICSADDDASVADGAGVQPKPRTHCPVCTLTASGTGVLPEVTPVLIHIDLAAGHFGFATSAACLSFHRARAGLSRAPPQHA